MIEARKAAPNRAGRRLPLSLQLEEALIDAIAAHAVARETLGRAVSLAQRVIDQDRAHGWRDRTRGELEADGLRRARRWVRRLKRDLAAADRLVGRSHRSARRPAVAA